MSIIIVHSHSNALNTLILWEQMSSTVCRTLQTLHVFFQTVGPAKENARQLYMLRRLRGMEQSWLLVKWLCRWKTMSILISDSRWVTDQGWHCTHVHRHSTVSKLMHNLYANFADVQLSKFTLFIFYKTEKQQNTFSTRHYKVSFCVSQEKKI